MYLVIWRYGIAADRETEFVATYSPGGPWSRLFLTSPHYLGTELLADQRRPQEYLTIDRWSSGAAYDEFLRQHRGEYERLDQGFEELTVWETELGRFQIAASG